MYLLVAFALGSPACSGDAASVDAAIDAGASDTNVTRAGDAQDPSDRDNPVIGDAAIDLASPDALDRPPEMDAAEGPSEELPWLDDPEWQCDNGVPISAIVDVVLGANTAGCPWGEGDNLSQVQSAFAAHQVTLAAAELPGPAAAICGVDLESAVFDPDYEQSFIYDDHFILAFDDVVLLSSYAAAVDAFPRDRNLYLFDWEAMAGTAMNFNDNGAYCLGFGGEDPVACSVPAPESGGPMAYSVGGGLGAALSSRAVQEQRVEFMLVTFGDNDPESDCRNGELRMQVVIDYVIAP